MALRPLPAQQRKSGKLCSSLEFSGLRTMEEKSRAGWVLGARCVRHSRAVQIWVPWKTHIMYWFCTSWLKSIVDFRETKMFQKMFMFYHMNVFQKKPLNFMRKMSQALSTSLLLKYFSAGYLWKSSPNIWCKVK